jgi:hypothetical protein
MNRHHIHILLNVILATVILSVLLGCGGDLEDPPPGSLAEKLCNKGGSCRWTSDPVEYTEIDQDGKMIEKTRMIEIDFSNWRQRGLHLRMTREIGAAHTEQTSTDGFTSSTDGFTYEGNTATSDPKQLGDGSKWTIQLDGNDPKVLYATWTLKDGTTRLDKMRFNKRR